MAAGCPVAPPAHQGAEGGTHPRSNIRQHEIEPNNELPIRAGCPPAPIPPLAGLPITAWQNTGFAYQRPEARRTAIALRPMMNSPTRINSTMTTAATPAGALS